MTDGVPITETLSFDKTAPTGKIEIPSRGAWERLLKKIGFGLFFKGEMTAAVTAEDTDSGISSTEEKSSRQPQQRAWNLMMRSN